MKLEEIRKVVSVGVSIFSDSLKRQGVDVIDIEWSPPAEIEEDLKRILDKLM